MKRTALMLVALLISLSLHLPAYANPSAMPVQPVSENATTVKPSDIGDFLTAELLRWSEFSSVNHGVSIAADGKATVTSKVNSYSSSTRINVTVVLEQKSGSSYLPYATYTASGTGSVLVSKTLYVPRGTYRVNTIATGVSETIDVYSTSSVY